MNTEIELKNNIQELIEDLPKIEKNDPFFIDKVGDKKEDFKNLSFSISNDDEVTSILTQRCELVIPECLLPSRSETPRKKIVIKRNDRSKSPQKKKSRSRSRSTTKNSTKQISDEIDIKKYEIQKFLDEYNYLFIRNILPLITSSNPNKEKIKEIISWFNDQRELIQSNLNLDVVKISNYYEDNFEAIKKLLNIYALVFCTYKKLK